MIMFFVLVIFLRGVLIYLKSACQIFSTDGAYHIIYGRLLIFLKNGTSGCRNVSNGFGFEYS